MSKQKGIAAALAATRAVQEVVNSTVAESKEKLASELKAARATTGNTDTANETSILQKATSFSSSQFFAGLQRDMERQAMGGGDEESTQKKKKKRKKKSGGKSGGYLL